MYLSLSLSGSFACDLSSIFLFTSEPVLVLNLSFKFFHIEEPLYLSAFSVAVVVLGRGCVWCLCMRVCVCVCVCVCVWGGG